MINYALLHRRQRTNKHPPRTTDARVADGAGLEVLVAKQVRGVPRVVHRVLKVVARARGVLAGCPGAVLNDQVIHEGLASSIAEGQSAVAVATAECTQAEKGKLRQ